MEPSERPYERNRMDRSWATPACLHVWTTLRFSPGPQTARELARRLGWHFPTVQSLLARLRYAGFVRFDRRAQMWEWAGDPVASLAVYRGEKS